MLFRRPTPWFRSVSASASKRTGAATALFVALTFSEGGLAASLSPEPAWHPTISTNVLPDGSRQRVLTLSPDHAHGTLVMLAGGAGTIGIESDGTIEHADNVVIRTAPLWLQRGFAIAIPDAIDGRNLRGSRAGAAMGEALLDVVAQARRSAAGPVFLVGTSQGAIAAVNGAARLPQGQIAGLVLLEAVSRLGGSHETIFDASPGRVTVPVLIVANTADRCRVSPPGDAQSIKNAFEAAPRVDIVRLSGGDDDGGSCSSHSPHGLAGLDAETVRTIADWIAR